MYTVTVFPAAFAVSGRPVRRGQVSTAELYLMYIPKKAIHSVERSLELIQAHFGMLVRL
jgi:hypothetical protein